MSYTKMTAEDFKQKLKTGHYKNATGARRGAGKSDMSEDEKAKCYKAIDAHFGEESTSAPAAKKTATKAVAKPAKKAAKAEAAPKKGVVRRTRRSAEATAAPVAAQEPADGETLSQLRVAQQRIGTIDQAIAVMLKAKEAYPQLDTQQFSNISLQALTDVMHGVHGAIRGNDGAVADPQAAELLQRTAAATQAFVPPQPPQAYPENNIPVHQ